MRCDIKILQLLFPSVLFTTTAQGIHLTFDDGPHSIATPTVLDILQKRNICATFFLLGENAQHYPDITKQIDTAGHLIGNHSYKHINLFLKDRTFLRQEIIRTNEIFKSIIGKEPRYFRPPYGYFNITLLNVLQELGLKQVLWNVNSKDWCEKKQASINHRVLRHTSNGSILLFHDNRHTVQALPTYLPSVLDILIDKGFIFNKLPS